MVSFKISFKELPENDCTQSDELKIGDLMEDIGLNGLRYPILVTEKYSVVEGHCRLEACRRLGWNDIDISIFQPTVDFDNKFDFVNLCQIARIETNVIINSKSHLEIACILGNLKNKYENLFPQARKGFAQANGMNRKIGNNVRAESALTFTELVIKSKLIKMSKRKLQYYNAIAEGLSKDIRKLIFNTPFERRFKDLIELAKNFDEKDQRKIIKTILSGKAISLKAAKVLIKPVSENRFFKSEEMVDDDVDGQEEIKLEHISGKSAQVHLSCELMYDIRYAIVNMDDLKTSHKPLENFIVNEDYPSFLQERDYETKEEQKKVCNIIDNFESDIVLVDTITAFEGAPIISPSGIVIAGNTRAMSLRCLLKKKPVSYEKYIKELKQKSYHFSIDEADIDKIINPILVRIVNFNENTEEALLFSKASNQGVSASRVEVSEASSIAEKLPNSIFEVFKNFNDATIGDMIRQSGFIDFMYENLQANYRNQFFENSEEELKLSEKVLKFSKHILLMKCLDHDCQFVENLPKRFVNCLISSLPKLIECHLKLQNDIIPPKFAIIERLIEAMRFSVRHVPNKNFSLYKNYYFQKFITGSKELPSNDEIHEFLLAIDDCGYSEVAFRKFIKRLVNLCTEKSNHENPFYLLVSHAREYETLLDINTTDDYIPLSKSMKLDYQTYSSLADMFNMVKKTDKNNICERALKRLITAQNKLCNLFNEKGTNEDKNQ